jgi:glycosyltransferase involved in cell wall biosynthesis
MKIAQVMLGAGFGGAERYFVDLVGALAKAGHEVLAICHPGFVQIDALQAIAAVATVNAHGNFDPFAARKLGRQLTAFAPDVVELHLNRAGLYGCRANLSGRFALTAHVHNYFKLKYFRCIDFFSAATRDQARYLIEHGVAADRVTVTPNFSTFAPGPRRDDIADRPLTFVALGRFVEKKGFDLLLRAFAAHLKTHPQQRLRLGGDGVEAPTLHALAQQLGIAHAVEFSGWIEDSQAFLQRGDVFVLPSRDEPFGIVVLEAMAARCSIISSRTHGPLEVLDDTTAWLVETGSVEALAQAMHLAAAAPDPRQRKADAAADAYLARYHIDQVLPQIEAVYRQTIALHAARSH